jgi:nicotinamidase-related amidase
MNASGSEAINKALLLIDVQKGFDEPYWGTRNNPVLTKNIDKLLTAWRANSMPVIHVKHMSTEADSPLRPNYSGNDFMDFVVPKPEEPVFEKTVNSAFIGTDLENYLRANQLHTLVVAGISTDHCVSTSTRMAGNLGFKVFLTADACATFNRTAHDGTKLTADEVHIAALASLHNEFATVLNTDEVLASVAGALTANI